MSKQSDLNNLENLMNDVLTRIESLEKKLNGLTGKETNQHFHIENMNLNHLESLTFRLDQLNIKELSGSLNMGNNFGVDKPKKKHKTNQPSPDKPKESKDHKSEPQAETIQKSRNQEGNQEANNNSDELKINNTSKGISVKFHSKD